MVAGFFSVRGTYSLFFCNTSFLLADLVVLIAYGSPFHTVKMLNFMDKLHFFYLFIPQKSRSTERLKYRIYTALTSKPHIPNLIRALRSLKARC